MGRYKLVIVFVLTFTMCHEREYKDYYRNGKLKYVVELKNGQYNGQGYKYDTIGNLIQKSNWRDGVKHGETVVYTENGEIDYRNLFQNGELVLFEDYDAENTLVRRVEMKDSINHGSYTEYYKNGKIKIKGEYTNGKETGYWRLYGGQGSITRVIYLKDGKIFYKKEFDGNNDLIDAFLPIKVEKVNSDEFKVSLIHTELQDLAIGVIIGSNLLNQFELADTLAIMKSDTSFVEIQLKSNNDSFYGLLYELDGSTYETESLNWFWYNVDTDSLYYNGLNYYLDHDSSFLEVIPPPTGPSL